MVIMVDNGWLYHVISMSKVDVRERKHQHVGDFAGMSPSNMYWVPGYVKIAIEHGHRNNEFSH